MLSLNDFHDLVQLTESELRAFINGWGIRPGEVDDVAQEVYLHYFEDPDRRPAAVSEIAWLKGIARNVCRDHVRQKERNRRHLEELGRLLRAHRAARERPRPGEEEEMIVHLQDCLEQLTTEQREWMLQRYVHGLATEEILEAGQRLIAPRAPPPQVDGDHVAWSITIAASRSSRKFPASTSTAPPSSATAAARMPAAQPPSAATAPPSASRAIPGRPWPTATR